MIMLIQLFLRLSVVRMLQRHRQTDDRQKDGRTDREIESVFLPTKIQIQNLVSQYFILEGPTSTFIISSDGENLNHVCLFVCLLLDYN